VVESVDVFELGRGAPRRIPAREVGFRYRHTELPGDAVIVGAVVRLRADRRAAIRARMDEARAWRRRTQPLAEPNCGSVFKNPEGDHAARLIEAVGGKGMSVGGVAVSTKHANFIVTSEGARAADVVRLIRTIQDLVARRFDVHLEPEVHLVGEFDLVPR
jgi:UDP-N-acetylmuramate dehydrogenase